MKEEVKTRVSWYKPADRTIVFYAPSWVAVMFLQFGYIDMVGPREWNKHKLTVLSGVNFWDALAKVRFVLDNLTTGTPAPHRDEAVLQHPDGHEVWVQCMACKNAQPLYSDMDGDVIVNRPMGDKPRFLMTSVLRMNRAIYFLATNDMAVRMADFGSVHQYPGARGDDWGWCLVVDHSHDFEVVVNYAAKLEQTCKEV